MNKMIEKFMDGEFVVNCRTEDQAREFVDICYDNEIEWEFSNRGCIYWYDEEKNTCYHANGHDLKYASKYFYKDEGYEVITFEEFMEEYMGMKKFTKDDLKTGMIVVNREGIEYVVIKGMEHGFDSTRDLIVNISKNAWDGLEFYTNDLLNNNDLPEMDIMEVYLAPHPYCIQDIDYERDKRKLVWKREEVKELTIDEISELLGYKVRVVGGNK